MSIQLTCPSGHILKVADAWAGRAGRCPVCKALVQVPGPVPAYDSVEAPNRNGVAPSMDAERARSPAAIATVAGATTVNAGPRDALAPPVRPPPVPRVSVASAPPPIPATAPPVNVRAPSPAPPPLPEAARVPREARDNAALPFSTTGAPQDTPPKAAAAPTGMPPPILQSVIAAVPSVAAEPPATPATVEPSSDRSVSRSIDPVVDPAAGVVLPGLRTGYQPDADKRWTVYYLAAAMAVLSLFAMIPALTHWNLGSAPHWARAILLLSLLQLAYAVWAASVPDWATLRTSMILYTLLAALYGLTMTVTLTAPLDGVPLDLADVRRQAVLWCAIVVLLASLLAYFCGRAAWRWRRMLERLHA